MGIWEYINGAWGELWNPDSRVWQYIDRILFPFLPLIALLLFIIPLPSGWRGIMANLEWLIPLSIWLLFLLLVVPYRLASKYHQQRDEARARCKELTLEKLSANLRISYRGQKWGFPNANVHNTGRMVNIGIDYNPSRLMQIAKISIKIDNTEYEAWSQHQFDIDKPEHHTSWFYLPHIRAGINKAKLVILANNESWESNEFDLDIPPKSLANSPSTSHKEGSQK